jgi:hypothetical protein
MNLWTADAIWRTVMPGRTVFAKFAKKGTTISWASVSKTNILRVSDSLIFDMSLESMRNSLIFEFMEVDICSLFDKVEK